MAIRRPHKPAEEFDATDLFAVNSRGADNPPPSYRSNFVVDTQIRRPDFTSSGDTLVFDRLRGSTNALKTNANSANSAVGSTVTEQDQMEGIGSNDGVDANDLSWMWRRAPGYFDVVTYTGGQSAGSTVNHNLGVVPEMMWVKNRTSTGSWVVKHKGMTGGISGDYYTYLDSSSAEDDGGSNFRFNPSSTQFTLSSTNSQINNSTTPSFGYIAYLFATVAGISKVGTFTRTLGDTTNVDCGFSNGARFVLLKRIIGGTGNWTVYDTVRGIVTGNDPYLFLNSTAPQVTNTDYIDPYSAGFTVTSGLATGTFVFYAIA
jgi:hypothetical protein